MSVSEEAKAVPSLSTVSVVPVAYWSENVEDSELDPQVVVSELSTEDVSSGGGSMIIVSRMLYHRDINRSYSTYKDQGQTK